MESLARRAYPSDVGDDAWAFVAPYLTLMHEDAPQRAYSLREVFNGLRWLVRAGAPWRMPPPDLPPWWAVYPQTQRWQRAGVFAAIVQDVRMLPREVAGRATTGPSTARAAKCMPQSTRSAICWRCWSRQRTCRIGRRWPSWPLLCRPRPGSGVRGSGLHRRAADQVRGRGGHPAGSGQTADRQAQFRLDRAVSPLGSRL